MSSPFQSAFMARSPLAEITNKMKQTLPTELLTAIEKSEGNSETPLGNHGEVRKELRKAKNENEQDYSMERVSKLEEEFKNAKEAHKASKGDPEAKETDRQDQNSQEANMPSPGNMMDDPIMKKKHQA